MRRLTLFLLSTLFLLPAGQVWPAPPNPSGQDDGEVKPVAAAPAAIDVGNRKQLMIDRRFIAESENIILRMNPPKKMGTVIKADKPWELTEIGFCVSVIQHEGLSRMWYLSQSYLSQQPDKPMRHCYAQSRDGIVWEKPNLGLFEFNGSKENNVVLTGIRENTVFLDPIAPPEARFKTVSAMRRHGPNKKTGIYVHTSPDGIHWKISDRRVLPFVPDTANQAHYDWRLKKYVAYIRLWRPWRKVGRIEMDDVTRPWASSKKEIPVCFGYDEHDPPATDHYNPACVQYRWADDAYFMFPSAFRHHLFGPVDIEMAVSRDGVNWNRVSREPYVPLGVQGEDVDSCSMYMAVGMVRSGNKIYQYYGGANWGHGVRKSKKSKFMNARPSGVGDFRCDIMRLEQRLDGFVSADAAYEGGELTTPPLIFSGKRLVLNIQTSAVGTCQVEILDKQGKPIAGYSLADCEVIAGNFIDKTVTWKGKSDVSSLASRAIRLRFVMRDSKLYAFQFAP